MSQIPVGVLLLVYLLFVVILPIATSVSFLHRRGHGVGMCLIAVASSLVLGVVMLCPSFLVAAHYAPAAHELWNAWGLFMGVLAALFIGAPLGTWAGAWSAAFLISRRNR